MSPRGSWPRGGVRTRLPVVFRKSGAEFTPRDITGLALWLDASSPETLYTTDAGAVTAVSAPTDIAGCVGWWDASDAATLYAADTGNTLATTTVGRWADKSAAGINLLQPTLAARPTSVAAAVNGRAALTFDGGDFLSAATSIALGNNTVMMVVREDVAVNFAGLISHYPATGNDNNNANGWVADLQLADNIITLNSASFSATWAGVSTLPMSVITLRRQIDAGDRQMIRSNGVTQAVSSSASTGTAAGILIGGRFQSGAVDSLYRARITLCEVLRWDRALSAAEYASVEAYLAAKWGISGVHSQATATSDPVGAWLDKSGNARHATQSTAGSRPVVGTQNGRKALTFDGTNDSFRHTPSTAIGSTGLTIIAALKHNLTSQPYYLSQPLSLTSAGAGRPIERWQGGASESVVLISNGTTNVGGSYRQQPDRFVYSLDAAKDFISSGTHQVREFLNGATNFDVSNTGVWSTLAQRINVGARDDGATQYKGDICEVLAYDRRLSTAERQRAERYLAARWGITLAPQVSNADAQDWINRVYANGGTVSSSTAAAVSTFCDAIDAASIRDRFYRLNLFCGGTSGTTAGLAACLVPLYRGQSLGGTQYGNIIDTNNNFAVGDYAETGASGGLTGNGSSKYLNTGVPGNAMSVANRHLSAYEITRDTNAYKSLLGTQDNGSGTYFYSLANVSPGTSLSFHCGPQATIASQSSGAHWIGSDQAASAMSLYKNGASAATSSGTNKNLPSVQPLLVFALNQIPSSVSPAGYSSSRLGGYSMGLALSDAQAAAYYTAMQAFQTALGRNV